MGCNVRVSEALPVRQEGAPLARVVVTDGLCSERAHFHTSTITAAAASPSVVLCRVTTHLTCRQNNVRGGTTVRAAGHHKCLAHRASMPAIQPCSHPPRPSFAVHKRHLSCPSRCQTLQMRIAAGPGVARAAQQPPLRSDGMLPARPRCSRALDLEKGGEQVAFRNQ